MKLTLTLRVIDNLQRLSRGETIPYTTLPISLRDWLISEGLLIVEHHGTRRCVHTPNAEVFLSALPQFNESLRDLEAVKHMLTEDSSRAAQASLSGNSKVIRERSCPGFLVNSINSVECTLDGVPFSVDPSDGSAVYIVHWESFIPSPSAIIVGVENMENFFKIRNQKELFESCVNHDLTQVLFVARYAFSSDLRQWLAMLPNKYLHFGDFDLAGIDIFLTQFKPYVGDRGSFLIPSDIGQRIKHGSRQRYNEQYAKYAKLETFDPSLRNLIDLIHHHRRTYDQEGYIK